MLQRGIGYVTKSDYIQTVINFTERETLMEGIMWIRSELKQRAKTVLTVNYWCCVFVTFIALGVELYSSGFKSYYSFSSGNGNYEQKTITKIPEGASIAQQIQEAIMGVDKAVLLSLVMVFLSALLFSLIFYTAIKVFVAAPITVGSKHFYMVSRERQGEIKEIFFNFRNHYLNTVGTMFLKGLFQTLWTFLFIIPGIVKSYEYRMVPYILSENPELNHKEVFRLSKEMMMGEKWDTFVLDLSFIGWQILSMLTCYVLLVFYVAPYQSLTDAELYAVLREKVLAKGICSTYELKGFSE